MWNQNKKISKIMILVFVIAFLLMVSYFTIYEGTYMFHDCTGTECSICQELHIAETFTKQIMPTAMIAAGCFYIVFFADLAGKILSSSSSERNLIIDKVRIDD